jgi:mRNA-degrading endonuclease RelE of RelBE toxin-antitoxin system
MVGRSAYRITFDPGMRRSLAAIDRKYHSLIRTTIAQQLSSEPTVATRNRKPLDDRLSFGATWELRFGPGNRFRVFYHVEEEQREVLVLAVGVKQRNRLFIGGVEVEP